MINKNNIYETINNRKELYADYGKLKPPHSITSDGEVIICKKKIDVPENTIIGTAASSGIVQGRANVVLNLNDADIQEGDILVTPNTDPAWTSLFPLISGPVTEVGGIMTHGSVVAREYGIPAVVGVDNATKYIKDKSIITINGDEGFIEIN